MLELPRNRAEMHIQPGQAAHAGQALRRHLGLRSSEQARLELSDAMALKKIGMPPTLSMAKTPSARGRGARATTAPDRSCNSWR
jgi:hypothetical protein